MVGCFRGCGHCGALWGDFGPSLIFITKHPVSTSFEGILFYSDPLDIPDEQLHCDQHIIDSIPTLIFCYTAMGSIGIEPFQVMRPVQLHATAAALLTVLHRPRLPCLCTAILVSRMLREH